VSIQVSVTVNGGFIDLRIGPDVYGLSPEAAMGIGIALTSAARKAKPEQGGGK